MERLDAGDASALLTFVSELKDVEDPLPFPPQVLQGLRDVIRCDAAHYFDLDPLRRCSRMDVCIGDREYVVLGVLPDECADAYELYWALRPTHPVCAYRMRTDDWTTPRKASDFVTLAGFRRTAIYDAQYRGNLDHWLDFGLAAEPDRTRVFAFTRKGSPDFTERDRLVASLVRPHLEARAKAAEDAAQAAAALATVEESTEREPRAIVLCSATGIIEYASRRSRALLKRYLGLDNGRLPSTSLRRDTITLVDDDVRLTIRIARTGALRILLLAEHDRRLERLTAREREVLDGVVHGWTNEEIALHLGLASATVAKHLEHVYEKLGVRTRTAAAALVSGTGVEPWP